MKQWQKTLLFVIGFLLLLISFFKLFNSNYSITNIQPFISKITAYITFIFLKLTGAKVQLNNTIIVSAEFSMQIAISCCAIDPIGILLCTILAFPSSILKKVIGILLGFLILFFVNIIRLVSLYYAGVNFNKNVFDNIHLSIWQYIFILIAIVLCLFYIQRVTNKATDQSDK